MIEIYASWTKGLPQNKDAMKLLFESELIDGIELGNTNNDIELIAESGLKVSAHTPGLYKTINLGKADYMDVFNNEDGGRILDIIHKADSPTVGFHLGYTADQIYKMKSFPNIPHLNSIITDYELLKDRLIKNIRALERRINSDVAKENQKNVLLETLDFSRQVPVPWQEQSAEAKSHKDEIEDVITRFGPNAALGNLTDSSAVKSILDEVNINSILPIGFLFDVAHNYISADAKIHSGIFKGSKKDYFLEMIEALDQRTMQIHINVPGGDINNGFNDSHLPFNIEDKLSIEILELANLVIKHSLNLRVLTLEIRTPYLPLKHAETMIEQADIVIKSLKLN